VAPANSHSRAPERKPSGVTVRRAARAGVLYHLCCGNNFRTVRDDAVPTVPTVVHRVSDVRRFPILVGAAGSKAAVIVALGGRALARGLECVAVPGFGKPEVGARIDRLDRRTHGIVGGSRVARVAARNRGALVAVAGLRGTLEAIHMRGSEKGSGDVRAARADVAAPLRTAVATVRLKDVLLLPQEVLLGGPLHIADLDKKRTVSETKEVRGAPQRGGQEVLTGTVKVPSQAAPSSYGFAHPCPMALSMRSWAVEEL